MNPGEQLAVEFLTTQEMTVERFNKEEMQRTKTPDFRVFKAHQLVAYCEAKHIQRDGWLDNQMKNAQPLEVVGGARPDPIFNRLTTHIHEAAAQFDAVNSSLEYPNILVFAKSDHLCMFSDLIRVLTGNEYTDSGKIEPIFKEYSEGRIRLEKLKIDLYLWKDIWPGSSNTRIRFFYVRGSKHYLRICNLLGSDSTKHRILG
ncbi:MAG: hypothetical protein HY313_08785 [Acidobacteria bacterium]|nr:hypothetical protein [Acidobacteriota bacterium]